MTINRRQFVRQLHFDAADVLVGFNVDARIGDVRAVDAHRSDRPSRRRSHEAAERQAIVAALQAAGGNRRAAAKQLGVSLRTLFYKIDRYQLE